MKTLNRRVFFKNLTYGSILITFFPSLISACKQGLLKDNLNCIDFDGILPVTFINDCSLLLLESKILPEDLQKSLTANINLNLPGNLSRIAAAMYFSDEQILHMLKDLVQKWKERTPELKLEHKLSLYLGWFIYSSIQDGLGDLYHKLIDKGFHYNDIRICHDSYLMRQFVEKMPDENIPDPEEILDLTNIMLPRMITRLHTLKPDPDDGTEWVNRMATWRRENYQVMTKFASAMVKPDQEQIDLFIVKPGFYNPEDPLISIVRNLQRGESLEKDRILSVVENSPGKSLYAKSLALGFKRVVLTGNYFTGELSFDEFISRFRKV